MDFDSASLSKLRGMDEKTLRELVFRIASAVGADPSQTRELLADPSGLRDTLNGLTPEQARGLLSQVGTEKASVIAELLRKEF